MSQRKSVNIAYFIIMSVHFIFSSIDLHRRAISAVMYSVIFVPAEAKYSTIKTKVIAADFTATDADLYDKIKKELNGLEIGTLSEWNMSDSVISWSCNVHS